MEKYIVENRQLALAVSCEKKRVSSFEFLNKRTGKTIVPAQESELFCLSFVKNAFFKKLIKASDLKIEKVNQTQNYTYFDFSPFTIKGEKVGVRLVYEIEQDKFYLRSHIELYVENKDSSLVLDYIDFAPIKIQDCYSSSCLPPQEKSHMGGTVLSLGQPVFLSSAFFGCEFPVTQNTIENSFVTVKYYSGKKLSELACENSVYTSFKAVIGFADSDSEVRLKNAFFEYIEDISLPLRFRRQYNSWYDHMLNISAENLEKSFLEIEKAMTAVGTKPLDCYVADDGWNNYAGDFWAFNEKFPNELYPCAKLAKGMGSSFGLWLGPRGGYTLDTIKFAKKVENGRNGYVNKRAKDVDVGSDKYIKKTADMMRDFTKRFELDYWKLDGFAQKACRDKNHDHMCGGKDDMYYFSDLWEKWINVFASLQEETQNKIFLNLTSYAPPSPWFLQWVNSMWIQVSDDMGMVTKDANGKKLDCSKKDMLLTYRDDKYYDFSKVRKFTFPAGHIYNHDPIYANCAKVTMSDEEFRDYLFAMLCRGTSFWELYYSFNMMNEEKWRINNSALCFAEENKHLLSKSVMFGGKPSLNQVYGYGCFAEDEGIVMLRNPSAKEQNFVLYFDHNVGADENFKNASAVEIYPYSTVGQYGNFSFGDKLSVTLAPFKTKIFHFGRKQKPMKAVYTKAKGKKMLEIMFNQPIVASEISCKENKVSSVKILDDYCSVLVEFENAFSNYEHLTIDGISDLALSSSAIEVEFEAYENDNNTSGVIKGKSEFSVVITTGGEKVDMFFSQGDEIEIGLKDNRFFFRVGNDVVFSQTNANDAVQLCAVRERNGLIKIYVDKKLDSAKKCENMFLLKAEQSFSFDENKVKLYSKALAYDEV